MAFPAGTTAVRSLWTADFARAKSFQARAAAPTSATRFTMPSAPVHSLGFCDRLYRWMSRIVSSMLYTYSNTQESLSMLAIRLPSDIEERLEALAKATGRTKTYYAREAILEHLEDLEDIYLAEQTLEQLRRGEETTHSLDDVEQDLGLAN
jgi:RHH-type rel operon transcriptional repressor/antitoxin RelB